MQATPDTKPTALAADRSNVFRLRYIAATISLAILVAIGVYGALIPHGSPDDFRVRGRNLIVLNREGRELWRHVFPWEMNEAAYDGEARLARSHSGELGRDRELSLLFLTRPFNLREFGTTLFCFGRDGRVKWRFTPGRTVVDGSGDRMVPPYTSVRMEVLSGNQPEDTRIVINSQHCLNQADQVAILDTTGPVVPEYWHPGHLSFAAQARLAGSDHPLLLLAGVNNGDHQATMVVLDPLRMSGVGTPKEMRDHRFELLNMPAAHEVATVLLPRSTPSLGQPYTRAMAMNVTTERIIVEVSENTDSLSQIGFVYEFDYFLHVVAVTPRNGVVAAEAHRKLEAEGRLHGAWNPAAECAQLKAGVIVRWSK